MEEVQNRWYSDEGSLCLCISCYPGSEGCWLSWCTWLVIVSPTNPPQVNNTRLPPPCFKVFRRLLSWQKEQTLLRRINYATYQLMLRMCLFIVPLFCFVDATWRWAVNRGSILGLGRGYGQKPPFKPWIKSWHIGGNSYTNTIIIWILKYFAESLFPHFVVA